MVVANSVTLSCRFDRDVVPQEEDTEAVLLLSLEASAPDDQPERKGIHFVIVLDKSASMGEKNKLELCKKTVQFLCNDILSEKDRLGLVVFDSEPTTVFPCVPMTLENKRLLLAQMSKVIIGDHTNLSGGLFQGLNALRDTQNAGEDLVTALLILTDGEATSGITDRDKLVRITRNVVNGFGLSKPTIHSFGYGQTYDPAIQRIAEETGGTFYHVANVEDVPLAFADSMGGILSTAAQNVEIQVNISGGGAEIVSSPLTQYPMEHLSGLSCRIRLRDIYLGEKKDVLVKLRLPKLESHFSTVEARITIRYLDIIKESFVDLEETCRIERIHDAVLVEPDVEVTRQIVRVDAANALSAAKEAMEEGDIEKGRHVLDSNVTMATAKLSRMNISVERDVMMREVMWDLRNAQQEMQAVHVPSMTLRSSMEQAAWTHSHQRTNFASATGMESRNAYVTPSKAGMADSAKKAFKM